MSLSQFTTAINWIPSSENPNAIYLHFVYDFPQLFRTQFPSAIAKCIGLIPDWEFHFNQKNRANIRPRFDTKLAGFEPVGKEYLMPAPEVKKGILDGRQSYPVCGVVFALNRHDDQIIEQEYAKQHRSRVLCRAWVPPRQGQPIDPKSLRVVSAFADLHHTRHGSNPATFMSPAEHHRWMDTVDTFTRHGVPKVLRDFVLNVVNGQATNKFTPIYVGPEAYPLEATRLFRRLKEKRELKDADKNPPPPKAVNLPNNAFKNHGALVPAVPVNGNLARVIENHHDEHIGDRFDNGYEQPLPPKAANLQEQYYRKHGILAPACPVNDNQAKVFEDYHDEVMRGQVDVDFQDANHLKATVTYWNRMSDRCDDGLDVFDAVKESRGERRWKHPNAVEGPVEDEDKDESAVQQPKPASNVVEKTTSNAANKKATNVVKQKPSNVVNNKKQRPQKTQGSHLTGQPPTKKQKVQQSSPARAPKCPQNQSRIGCLPSTISQGQQKRPAA